MGMITFQLDNYRGFFEDDFFFEARKRSAILFYVFTFEFGGGDERRPLTTTPVTFLVHFEKERRKNA